MKIVKATYFVFLLLLIPGCSAPGPIDIPEHIKALDNLTVYPADTSPALDIELVREQTFGADGEVLIGEMAGMVVDEAGRVFIADADQLTVHVFAPDGRYLTHLGREGRGPGEFTVFKAYPLHIDSTNIYVWDYRLRRINIFSLETLEPSGQLILDPQSWSGIEELRTSSPFLYAVRNDGIFLVGFMDLILSLAVSLPHLDTDVESPNMDSKIYRRYYLMDSEGQIISDPIFKWKLSQLYKHSLGSGMGFARSMVMAASDEGYMFSAWTEEFLIQVRGPDGAYRRAFYYPFKKNPLNREYILNHFDKYGNPQLQSMIEDIDWPDTWPAVDRLLVDDENRLWVSTILDYPGIHEWRVLDQYGKLLARFTWPGYKDIEMIKNGCLYVPETEKSGIQKVVRYRIEMD